MFEVKGHTLDCIESIRAGEFQVTERGRSRTINPVKQARTAMFDIKHAVERSAGNEVRIPFFYWIVLPNIRRPHWRERWGKDAFEPAELLFGDDLGPEINGRVHEATGRMLRKWGIEAPDPSDLEHVLRAFGDSAVLSPHQRERAQTVEGTLGERFEELAFVDKKLSDRQQQLVDSDWREGPRVVRGVAGSGKTVVLATKMARLAERWTKEQLQIFEGQPRRRMLGVCFNRTLVPFIKAKVLQAFQQRTGRDSLPEGSLEITHVNALMWQLSQAGLWDYQRISDGDGGDGVDERARQYLSALLQKSRRGDALVDALRYDAIWVDEGQDFVEDEYRILLELCRKEPSGGEPSLFIFYDDAQNVYGRRRPTWADLGLNVKGGRSDIMMECFRNTRQIVEPSFNVLLGATTAAQTVGTHQFANTDDLLKKGVLTRDGSYWRVEFATREGPWPEVAIASSPEDEVSRVASRVKWLVTEEKVRPEDILVLAPKKARLREIAASAQKTQGWKWGSVLPFEEGEKDQYISREGQVTFSTVQSAKGYDAFCVIVASANEFSLDVQGRATFYVACTRAREHLDVFAYADGGLVSEMSTALRHLSHASSPAGS